MKYSNSNNVLKPAHIICFSLMSQLCCPSDSSLALQADQTDSGLAKRSRRARTNAFIGMKFTEANPTVGTRESVSSYDPSDNGDGSKKKSK